MPGQIGATISFTNNTVAQDCTGNFGWQAATGVVVRDNIQLNTVGASSGRQSGDPTDGWFGSTGYIVYSQYDYNVYGPAVALWNLRWNQTLYRAGYTYASFAAWQAANSVPHGPLAPTPPPELSVTGNPDANGRQLATFVNGPSDVNFTDPSVRNYALKVGSALNTASSTGGRVGYDPNNSGPGW